MLEPSTDAPKREEQVLVLAAGGLTDKEIAIRLGISPDTVGTYWRRVLAKFQAASRTECVAKYMETRGKQAIQNLEFVNECLTLVNEHMLEFGIGADALVPRAAPVAASAPTVADAILASVQQWILVVDKAGKVIFSNRPTPPNSEIEDLLDGMEVLESIKLASQGPVEIDLTDTEGSLFEFVLTPGTGSIRNLIVASGLQL